MTITENHTAMIKTKQTEHEATSRHFINKKDVAALLGVGQKTIERLGRAGKLPTLTITKRIIRYDKDAVIAYVNSRFCAKGVKV